MKRHSMLVNWRNIFGVLKANSRFDVILAKTPKAFFTKIGNPQIHREPHTHTHTKLAKAILSIKKKAEGIITLSDFKIY